MNLLRIHIVIFCVLIFFSAEAQDIHFSQFYLSPLTLNPALAGAINNDQRMLLNYKNQWESFGTTFRTYAASYDLALMKKKLKGRYIGLGLSAYSDKAGTSEFGNTQVNLSVAYNLLINKKNQIAFAVQGGWGQRSAQLMNLRWDSQYTGSNYDPNLPTGEEALNENATFIDLGAGILWRKRTDNGFDWSLGGAAFHLNEPNLSLIGTSLDNYLRKYVVHGEVRIDRKKYVILPKFFVAKQGGAYEFNIGGLLQRRIGRDSRYTRENTSSSFYLGAFYRVNDAIVPTVQLEYKRMLSIGISYDVNISKLSDHTLYRGGMELAIVYHAGFTDRRRKLQKIEGVN